MPRDTERADRILDAAGELLLRHGYRKVTIDDVARQAGVGKGTVYLHWKTKLALFQSLLVRESLELTEEMRAAVRAEPTEVRPHRLLRMSYLASFRRPLVLALTTRDTEVLGDLRQHAEREHEDRTGHDFMAVLARTGLLRADLPDLGYGMHAAALGFFLVDDFEPGLDALARERKADLLAHVVRTSFEPAAEPSETALRAAADEIDRLLTELITGYRELLDALDAANPGG
ncbi:TetR/AcrR family transcriptional regulator [Saccharopolyspora sp. MS10]|uniref:TetR/AcrR family transcriptional regulator n=1 Tax=Saccharopolyspora sp. MS10 TaxID=3385973 RepID=UPI0039A09314